LEWQNSVLLDDDVPAAIAALKETDGPELQVHGSADLLQTLMRHDLIDEYRLWTFPVLVGTGKRLFADGVVPGSLELVTSSVSTTGVVIGTYRPAGAVTIGSFALE
jgi:dihydrofolate reductase